MGKETYGQIQSFRKFPVDYHRLSPDEKAKVDAENFITSLKAQSLNKKHRGTFYYCEVIFPDEEYYNENDEIIVPTKTTTVDSMITALESWELTDGKLTQGKLAKKAGLKRTTVSYNWHKIEHLIPAKLNSLKPKTVPVTEIENTEYSVEFINFLNQI